MSPLGIQEQIDEIQQSIDDLESSASGVLAYVEAQTIKDYDNVWWRTFQDDEERISDLNEGIVEASGYLRVLNNGITFHRH